MKKRVLITGCNGVLGRNLVTYLKKYFSEDYHLVLLDITKDDEQEKDFETYQCDIRKKNDIDRIIKDINIVVHCASASPAYDEAKIYDIVINGTNNLLESAFNTGNVERFIYISSTSVYGVAESIPVRETDKAQPYDPYNKAKIEAEKLCTVWREKGKCVPILRPRSFLGPERLGTFAILYEWASEGRNFPMLGAGSNRYQMLDVEDLCQAIYLTMTVESHAANDIFNIGAGDFGTIRDDYQAVLDEAGFNKRIICFPATLMFIALRILEKLKLSPFYKRLYKKLNKDYYVSIDRAVEKLGYKPKYSNKDSLIRNYYWYLESIKTKTAEIGPGNNNLWKQGALKYIKLFF